MIIKEEEMRQTAINELNKYFGDLPFVYEILDCGSNDCVVLTIYDECEANEKIKNINLYKIFKIGNKIEINSCLNSCFDVRSNTSLVTVITDIIGKYIHLSD